METAARRRSAAVGGDGDVGVSNLINLGDGCDERSA